MQYEFLTTVEMFVILGNTEHALRVVGNGPSYSIEEHGIVSEQCLRIYSWKVLERLSVLVNFPNLIENFLQPHTFIFFIKMIVSLMPDFKMLEMRHAIFLSRD